MRPSSYMRSVDDRNVAMLRIPVHLKIEYSRAHCLVGLS